MAKKPVTTGKGSVAPPSAVPSAPGGPRHPVSYPPGRPIIYNPPSPFQQGAGRRIGRPAGQQGGY